MTLNGEIAGPLGGFGWHLRSRTGAPRQLNISRVQVPHDTKLLLSVAYPSNVTSVSVVAHAPSWCLPWESASRRCSDDFFARQFDRPGARIAWRYLSPRGRRADCPNRPAAQELDGQPTWTVPINPEPPFVRDGVRIHATRGTQYFASPLRAPRRRRIRRSALATRSGSNPSSGQFAAAATCRQRTTSAAAEAEAVRRSRRAVHSTMSVHSNPSRTRKKV